MVQTRNGGRGKQPRAAEGSSDKIQQLQTFAAADAVAAALTTNQALRIADNHNSLKAGPRGPTLLEDFILREKIQHFGHERIPERVVYARGAGAHGHFQLYRPLSEHTTADFLNDPEQRTPVFVRFSAAAGAQGSADTVRDVRGFAVKFYTREGNFDLVGSNIPVFYIQDAIKYPDLVHAIKPAPHHDMPQASTAHDAFWDFASLMPETTHMLMWTMSDRALPRSYRMMEGFGVHTFRLVNGRGEPHLVKFHWKPRLGVHALAWDEAQKIAGKDPDFLRRDLWEAIEAGHFPEWELGLQVVPEHHAADYGFDLLDPTKLIPEELVPVQRVGKLVLDRNPDNFFAETEQVAFHPGHLVPGIDFTADPLLQGRLLSYGDAQIGRLGGPNFHELPINRSLAAARNFQRGGRHRMQIDRGPVAYEPHSLGQATEFRVDGGPQGFQSFEEPMESPKQRRRSPSFDDHFTQATLFWNSMGAAEKEHIVHAFRYELSKVVLPAVRRRVVDNLAHVDPRLAMKVAAGLGLDAPDPKAAAGQVGFRDSRYASTLEESAALGMAPREGAGIGTRRIAVLAADGVDGASLRPILQGLAAAGADCRVLASRLGTVATASGRRLEVQATLIGMPSVMFDAVLVPGGKECADALARMGEAVHFVLEAYKHGKPVCAVADGVALLRLLDIAPGADPQALAAAHPGVVLGADLQPEGLERLVQGFVQAIARHRHWDRPAAEALPV
ncbi:MAG: catalase [Xylophilus ampelinus]